MPDSVVPPLLLHAFSTFAVGGPQARFATLANHFGARFRHAIVAMDGNLAARERLDPALDVTFPDLHLPKRDTLGNVWRLRRALRALRPATLITSNWGTIEWAMANRLPIVRHIHVEDGFGPDEQAKQNPRRVRMRRVFLAGRTVVVPSLTLRRIALETWRLAPSRVRYVPNGIDLRRFAGGRIAPLPGDGPVIGTVAALRAEKNLARLLRAFARLAPPIRLCIVGDGPERAALERLAAELGVAPRVVFAGHIPEPAAYVRAFDVFAMSSDTEQMPISLLEAMAAGRPVAATDVGDTRAILPPEQAPFVVPGDPEALAAALARLVAEPMLRAGLGAANRAKAAAAYDQAGMFAAWGEVFSGTGPAAAT